MLRALSLAGRRPCRAKYWGRRHCSLISALSLALARRRGTTLSLALLPALSLALARLPGTGQAPCSLLSPWPWLGSLAPARLPALCSLPGPVRLVTIGREQGLLLGTLLCLTLPN